MNPSFPRRQEPKLHAQPKRVKLSMGSCLRGNDGFQAFNPNLSRAA
jgi:hypothetical protein